MNVLDISHEALKATEAGLFRHCKLARVRWSAATGPP